MNYLLMVSHGEFAYGTHSVLDMMVGSNREDVISVCLEADMSSNEFQKKLLSKIAIINKDDNIIVFGDIIGGSPLTSTIETLNDLELIENTMLLSGLNVASALNAVILKDQIQWELLSEMILNEGKNSLIEIDLNINEEDEEI